MDLGGNRVNLGGTWWIWVDLGGTGRIWVELGGIILSENAIYIYYYNSTHSCSRVQCSCSFQFSMYDMIRKNDSS